MHKGGFELKACIKAKLLKCIPEYKLNHLTIYHHFYHCLCCRVAGVYPSYLRIVAAYILYTSPV